MRGITTIKRQKVKYEVNAELIFYKGGLCRARTELLFGCVADRRVSGMAELRIEKDHLQCVAPSGQLAISYADLDAFDVHSYQVLLQMEQGPVVLSPLGQQTDPFFCRLWDAYNAKIWEALFVSGVPLVEAEGDYRYCDANGRVAGRAILKLFDDCLCILFRIRVRAEYR